MEKQWTMPIFDVCNRRFLAVPIADYVIKHAKSIKYAESYESYFTSKGYRNALDFAKENLGVESSNSGLYKAFLMKLGSVCRAMAVDDVKTFTYHGLTIEAMKAPHAVKAYYLKLLRKEKVGSIKSAEKAAA